MQPSTLNVVQYEKFHGYQLWKPPVINWTYRIANLTVQVAEGNQPCAFHRASQRLLLGIRWSYVGCRRPREVGKTGWRCSLGDGHEGPCAAHPQGWRKFLRLVRGLK